MQVLVLAAAAREEHSDATEGAGLGLMEQLVLWAGFLGAWLVVAGPLHRARYTVLQAVREVGVAKKRARLRERAAAQAQ